jgi:hypothetical protein
MAYTDVGGGGRIYDANEINRLNDVADKFTDLTDKMDKKESKKKDTIRYIIIGVSAVVILALLRIAVKSKK